MAERLSPLDGSFLRVETENAHMHFAWTALLDPPESRPRPTLRALRRHIAGRLHLVPRFRQRLAPTPLDLAEPCWEDDPDFELAEHVVSLSSQADRMPTDRFAALTDAVLSQPLDRDRPLWRLYVVPRLEDGRIGLVAKMHHAMVDGRAAVALALLLFDARPGAQAGDPPAWSPRPGAGTVRRTADVVADGAVESYRAVRAGARLAGSPVSSGARLGGTLRRAALAMEEDLLRPAPPSFLNGQIGPERTLVGHRAPLEQVRAIKEAAAVTLNDVCLAAVTGALRELAMGRGELPRPLKAMVPVSVRGEAEEASQGNRISLAFIDLPLQTSSPRERLRRVHEATSEFKREGRAAGTAAVIGALGLLPGPLKGTAVRMIGGPRAYNLTVSNVPGPSDPLYVLGAELSEAYPAVPIADDHALSVGLFTYRGGAHFGFYADPGALPDARELPDAMNVSLLALGQDVAHATPARRVV